MLFPTPTSLLNLNASFNGWEEGLKFPAPVFSLFYPLTRLPTYSNSHLSSKDGFAVSFRERRAIAGLQLNWVMLAFIAGPANSLIPFDKRHMSAVAQPRAANFLLENSGMGGEKQQQIAIELFTGYWETLKLAFHLHTYCTDTHFGIWRKGQI